MDVVIPYNIVDKVCQRRKVNVIATFLSLKTMFEGGSIHHFYKRLKEVSSYTGQSKKTLKSHVNELTKDGLVHMEGEHLILAGKRTLCDYFGVEVKSHSYKHVLQTSHKVKNIKSQIRKLVIAENQAKQKHILKKKKNEDTGKSYPWLETHTRSDETILNMFDAEKIQISQRRYAKLLGCKWASSGFYHLRKLLLMDELTIKPVDPVFITKGNKKILEAIRERKPSLAYFISGKGNIYQRLPNLIVLK